MAMIEEPVPVTPRARLNVLVPLVPNANLVAETEKLHVKLDAVSVDIARVSNIMQVVGEAEPLPPVPALPEPAPVDNLAQILDEMRIQQRETRDSIALWAMFMMFVFRRRICQKHARRMGSYH